MGELEPLIGELEDGTLIYRNAVVNSRGVFSVNVGIYNFSDEFNPNNGRWNSKELAAFSTNVGSKGSLTIRPGPDGFEVDRRHFYLHVAT